MRGLLYLVTLFVLSVLFYASMENNDLVWELAEDNFDDLTSGGLWLIEFYAVSIILEDR